MNPEWYGTPFADLVRRLKREMSADDLLALYHRDFFDLGVAIERHAVCVLCLIHLPYTGVAGFATCYHHIDPRGMGGGTPNQLPNLAPACPAHHQEPYHSFTELWQRAMVKAGKAQTSDYPNLVWDLSPLTQECIGLFGYGNDNMPLADRELVQKVFAGVVDRRLSRFCDHLCPRADECLMRTRKDLMEKIQRARRLNP